MAKGSGTISSNRAGGVKLSPKDMMSARGEVSLAKSALSRAERNLKLASAAVHHHDDYGTAKKSESLENTIKKYKVAETKYEEAKAKYEEVQRIFEAKLKAYQADKPYKG